MLVQNEIHSLRRKRALLQSRCRRLENRLATANSSGAHEEASTAPRSITMHDNVEDQDISKEEPPTNRPRVSTDGRFLRATLLGHLQKAQRDLASERDNPETQRRMAALEHVDAKVANQERQRMEAVMEEMNQKLTDTKNLLSTVEEELSQKQSQLMGSVLTNHYSHMAKFIATKTQPTLWWMPGKESEALEPLRRSTSQFVGHKLEDIKTRLGQC
ncbi:pinin/SDK/memA/ protein conserved region family protein [Babesia bovis T2Bo]|uniref:Pinin/SDK/MemA protein domain-containing protein n=1 Tax=Babesia bovis TaxID=5865 RepID=A7AP84_BABBO|nr:pinin/SDK/memA/ protein conserved region family protein [Babesia bovis T2Bo]EDO08368.1 pinin/SDK/memA/ protein conserved region family protein [Babesia bovis T2Bo]|eukprot:XP_001611936.1 hypothetical protein [Babesia bovis T2Bo]